ncbi:MAG: TrkH family potassium uptake protein [Ruminococcaceae bacterium]|nr:TrkH family potassium uptake protein [Oscillospiraceae bacterium]
MNYRMLRYLLGCILLIEAILLLLPLATAIIYKEDILPFVYTICILLVISVPCVLLKPKNTHIYAREGFICVSAAWILLSVFGALPFVFSGVIPNFIDALFETVSGFTTTGASILTAVEGFPRSILFWRSFTHWVGGMGVLVFMLAILPSAGGEAIHLMRAEVPGPTKGKLVPKMRQTALILYGIYIVLTCIEFIALLLCGFPLYDSIVTSFATAGTGGFSVLNSSIAGYANPAAEWVIAVFMILFGINFNLFFLVLIGKVKEALKSEELKVYLGVIAVSVVVVSLNIFHLIGNLGDSVRTAFFQVASIMTTTGFVTVEFNDWPVLSKTILTLLMIIGACAGSTAGGLKISRILILFKNIFREIKHMIRPRSVNVVRVDGEVISDETVRSATGYLTVYMLAIVICVVLISIDGYSMETNITATLSCINNIGPALGDLGAMGNFSVFSPFSKVVLTLAMLLGRLEFVPMIVFFSPYAWKKR